MGNNGLLFGDKTPSYPHGYGFCQDGCGKITILTQITPENPDGVWASYLSNHEPKSAEFDRENGLLDSQQNSSNFQLDATDTQVELLSNVIEVGTGNTQRINSTREPIPRPSFGDRTREYPKGYGYCQCGCEQVTRRNSSGEYVMYLSKHIGLSNESVKRRDIPRTRSRGRDLGSHAGAALETQSYVNKGDDWRLSGSVKYLYPDQAVLEEYTRLAQKFGKLTRTLEGAQADIERSIRAIDKSWAGEHESKTRILEILRNALYHIKQA